jgi:LCP family protein required for cell wall assembly
MRPDPSRISQRLAGQIEAGRPARRRRVRLLVVSLLSALTLLVSGSAWALTSYVSSSLGRINAGTSGTPSSGPVNILVAGVDTRGGLTRQQEIELHVGNSISENSDTLMLVHIPANHARVEVVSIPRDSWVDIPGRGMNKINAAVGFGGPPLMVRTVEQATGLVINDYVEINFLGFVKVIDALGGVNICLPYAVDDSYSGLHMSAGEHHVDGVTALEFARDRHSFALSDITRISDQQQLLSSAFTEMLQAGVLADPFRLQHVLSAVASSVTVDSGFDLVALADELRGLRPADVTFTTVPLASINYTTPAGASAVLWDKPAADALFARLRADKGIPAHHSGSDHRVTRHRGKARHDSANPALIKAARSRVSIDVYNGTMITGLSARTGRELAKLGFHLDRATLNWANHDVARTLIEYPPGDLAAAQLLRAVLPGAAIRASNGLKLVKIVLGGSGHSVTGAAPASHVPTRSASTSTAGAIPTTGRQKTAAQDACH